MVIVLLSNPFTVLRVCRFGGLLDHGDTAFMDLNRTAFSIVQKLTSEAKEDSKMRAAAQSAGGVRGGIARAAKLSPERRREIAVSANAARWLRQTDTKGDGSL